jgi:glycosyltransferase involved in cell wall biosynthesis
MRELASKVDELIIVTPRPYIPKFMTRFKNKWSKWYLDPMVSTENGMEIIRPYFLCLRGGKHEGINGILMYYSLSGFSKNLIELKNIDLIIGYNMIPDGIAAVKLANHLKLPVVFWAIGTDVNDVAKSNRINYYLSQQCISNSNLILAESKDLENKINQFSTRPLNVQTFYKGIDISNFQNLLSKNDLLKKLNLDQGKKYILFIGRLVYGKGIYELAQVFHNVACNYPDLELILIGEEIEKGKLQRIFMEDGLLNRVHFKGIVSHKEVAYYMKLSDLLVFPSWSEGLPNVIMEAMAIGLPVVATDTGGISEILGNGVTGLSVPVKNVEKLTEAVTRMINDGDLRNKCVKNAKELIHNKFDVKKNVFKLIELLHEVKNSYSKN